MSLIMHVFGLAHLDALILQLLVNTGERHKQTTHIVATITQSMTRVFLDVVVIVQKSVSKREHGVSSRLSPTKSSLFVITGLWMSLQVPAKLERTLFASHFTCTAWRWTWCRSCFHGGGRNNGFRPPLSPRTCLALCFTASSGKPRHT